MHEVSDHNSEITAQCPALFLSAPASGQGKTTITAGLARLLRRQGKRVFIFKTGPDYLDPQILEQASGNPVVQLDLWMAGEDWCRQQFYLAAQQADLILVEGAMGLFDGEPSSADLAERFGIPVALVVNVGGMAQTAAAVASGLAKFRSSLEVFGLLANHCNSERHRQLIEEALPEELPLLAALKRADDVALPERHLGLVQACEQRGELEQILERAADWLAASIAPDFLNGLPLVSFQPVTDANQLSESLCGALIGRRIGIARDAAFSFIYDANVQLLKDMGAELLFFSPLYDQKLPDVDAVWLPGGYPELHAHRLSSNRAMIEAVQAHYHAGRTLLAECGGFLYCLEALKDLQGNRFAMTGLLAGVGEMRDRGGCQGMQAAPLPEGEVRGHAHHRSRSHSTPEPIAFGRRQRHPAPGEEIYRQGGLTASYLHLFFPSNPEAVARLFGGKTPT